MRRPREGAAPAARGRAVGAPGHFFLFFLSFFLSFFDFFAMARPPFACRPASAGVHMAMPDAMGVTTRSQCRNLPLTVGTHGGHVAKREMNFVWG